MLFRRVTVQDSSRLASFVDRLPRESMGPDIGRNIFSMRDELAELYLRGMRHRRLLEVLVAELEGRIVGVCDLKAIRGSEDAFAHLAEIGIMVSSDALRRGVGISLLEKIKERAGQIGIEVLLAYVREGNVASERLFKKGEFEVVGRIPCYFKIYGNYYDGLIFWRRSHES